MSFIRLIRPLNLLVIALTMYAVRSFVLLASGTNTVLVFEIELDFFLLVFSTVLIAAAGNIINDYFDVRADRINKPEKLIITKSIKPRWAIVSHWILNFVAFIIAARLSWKYHTFWYVFIDLLTINLLWIYSVWLKRKFLTGNLLIAALTALVPILAGIFFYYEMGFYHARPNLEGPTWLQDLLHEGKFIYVLAIFAFALNFIREIIKDIQDVEGDKLLRAKTIPIVMGIKRTKSLAAVLLVVVLILGTLIIGVQWQPQFNESMKLVLLPTFIIALFLILSLIFLLKATSKSAFKTSDFYLKLAMMVGCTLPFYWAILL